MSQFPSVNNEPFIQSVAVKDGLSTFDEVVNHRHCHELWCDQSEVFRSRLGGLAALWHRILNEAYPGRWSTAMAILLAAALL